ncbi:hypothetical protein PSAR109036_11890 [Psychrobacter arenosus]
MMVKAQALGADAIVGIRFSTASIAQGASEIFVYGTAVRAVSNAAPNPNAPIYQQPPPLT